MFRTLLAAFLAALLLAPAAEAALLAKPLEIEATAPRFGDIVRYEYSPRDRVEQAGHEVRTADGWTTYAYYAPPEPDTRLVRVEGVGRADDRFGLPRDVVTYAVEDYRDGRLLESSACHVLLHGFDLVRRDVRYTVAYETWRQEQREELAGVPLQGGSSEMNTTPRTSYGAGCDHPLHVKRPVLREGDRIPILDLFLVGDLGAPEGEVVSAPGVATTFHGRPALRFDYDLAATFPEASRMQLARASYVVAEGIPGAANVSFRLAWTDEEGKRHEEHGWRAVTGFVGGDGDPVPPPRGARLPDRHPAARFAPYDPLALDERALRLAFPYREAFEAAVSDPSVGFAAWLREHPDATLTMAIYDRHMRDWYGGAVAERTETDGGWYLLFSADGSGYLAAVQRDSGVRAGSTPLALPVKRVNVFGMESTSTQERPPTPDALLAGDVVAAAVAGADVAPGTVASLTYMLFAGYQDRPIARLVVSDVPSTFSSGSGSARGHVVALELTSGALSGVSSTERHERREGLLATVGGGELGQAPAERSAFTALVGPVDGLGFPAGAAATGLALLVLLVKLVAVPLYTRLRRDRLLDNPVRARLYDHVRREPGVLQAELIDLAGVGNGATRRHLDQLVRHRFLVEVREGGRLGYYAAGDVPPHAARQAAVLRSDTTRRVYELLAAEPSLTLRQAAARLGMSAPGVHRQRKKLEAAGLLPAPAEAAAVLAAT